MIKRRSLLRASAFTLLAAVAVGAGAFGASIAAAADTQLGPYELVTKVAESTLKDLDAHRSEYQKDPSKVRQLVDKNMLPYFDTAYAAQLVLGKNWRTATEDQRKRFIEGFYQSMLQNYGDALLEFTPDRLKILPFQGKPDEIGPLKPAWARCETAFPAAESGRQLMFVRAEFQAPRTGRLPAQNARRLPHFGNPDARMGHIFACGVHFGRQQAQPPLIRPQSKVINADQGIARYGCGAKRRQQITSHDHDSCGRTGNPE